MNNPRFIKSIPNSFFTTVHFNIPWDNQIPSEFTTFLDHDLFIDLHLIGNCSISKIKNTNRSVTFIIKGNLNCNILLKIIRESFRYVYEIEIPLCLYSQKHLFYANCVNIMHKHKCVIYVQITNKIKFFIGGRSKDVNNCRLEILKEIEDFLGNKPEIIKGEYDLVKLIREEGKRVFVGSFIDNNSIVVSKEGLDSMKGKVDDNVDDKGCTSFLNHYQPSPFAFNPLKSHSNTLRSLNSHILTQPTLTTPYNQPNLTTLTTQPTLNHTPTTQTPLNNNNFLEMIHLDPLKYTWILLYKKSELDNILIKFSTYLNVIESSPKITKLMFMSLSKINLKNALIYFNEIYNLILIVNFSNLIYQKIEKIIIFEDKGISTVIGEIKEIKEVMSLKEKNKKERGVCKDDEYKDDDRRVDKVDKGDGFIKPNPYTAIKDPRPYPNSNSLKDSQSYPHTSLKDSHPHNPYPPHNLQTPHNPYLHTPLKDINSFFEAFIDIDSETLDFMCGKKNGKIIKIMKGLGCTIEVIRRNGFEKSHVFIKGKKVVFSIALSMIYSEFLSHINFNIDSKYHKGIIGYGGKNIQKMMKKHGVYIKFMSLNEMNQEGFEFNVLIKTPKKNESNLQKMKNELFEVIEEKQEEEKEFKEINYEEFYYKKYKKFMILFDKFLIKEKFEKVYYYKEVGDGRGVGRIEDEGENKDENRDVSDDKVENKDDNNSNIIDINNTLILKNGDKFIKTHLKLKTKPITVGHWLIVVPEESRNLYVLTISGMRIIYKLFEEQNENNVIECKFLN